MLVSDVIAYSMRVAGILGVGQVALPQDLSDASVALQLMLQQWRQKRWIVFRLSWDTYPLLIGKQSYQVGPGVTPPDFQTDGLTRPANIQSCFLRQNVGSGPNSYPIDFPMRILQSRQQYDRLSLKFLQSWPAAIYYDPTIANATLYIWPIPVQNLFSLYIAWQEPIDLITEESGSTSLDFDDYVPVETQEAIVYNLALRLITNYKLPPDQSVQAAARATLNTLRQTNFALQPLRMPQSLRPGTRLKNPMGGFYPEVAAGVPVTSLG